MVILMPGRGNLDALQMHALHHMAHLHASWSASLFLRTLHRPAIAARDTHVEMTARLNALVIGGSIGGLSTAHALLRAGCDVTVLERAPEVSGNSLGAVSRCLFHKRNRKHFRVSV